MSTAPGASPPWAGIQPQFLAAVSCAPLILFATDRAGVLTFLAGRGLDTLGLEPGHLLGRSLLDLCSRSIADLEGRFQRALAGEELASTFEWGSRTFEAEYRPLRDELGAVVGLIGVAHDVSEQIEIKVEMDRRNRELLTLQAAGAAITSSLDLQMVLDTVTREMANLLQMRACTLSRWSGESRTTSLLARTGPEGWWTGRLAPDCYRPIDLPSTGQALDQRQARQITADDPGLDPAERAYLRETGIQVLLKLPMVYQGRVMGLVEVMDNRGDRLLGEDEIALAHLLANQAASAIENARLYDAVRRHIAEVTTLNRISQVITSILDLHETLAIIADHALWLLDVAAASVILYDQACGDLWFGAASGEGAEFIRGKRLPPGQGIVDWVIRQGEPLLAPDVALDPRFFGNWDKEMGFTTRSILCVPLKTRGRTIGAIEAVNKASGDFDREDLMLLTSMAASAAIAIENARLYQELQAHATTLEQTVAARTRELEAERDRTQAILEAVGEAVIVTDLGGAIQYVNPAAVELTGYTPEEVVGRSPGMWQMGETAAARGEVVSRRKDGSLYDAAMTVAPLLDSQQGGRPVGYVCVQRDITPIKEAERLKDEFVSNVSHELRTPLSIITLISGNLERLYSRLSDERRLKMIGDIRDQADVLNDLVRDILEISRIESGRVAMDRESADLGRLVSEEVEKQRPLAHKRLQTLRAVCTSDLAVWGNANQLRQVIRNLLSNAIKFTPERGSIQCECRLLEPGRATEADWPGLGELPAGRWAAVRVVDTGIGISAEDLPRLYERFYRVETQSNVPGTGLGLSIVRELVQLHDGHIAASSTLGQGSTFAVYLPLLEE